MTARKPISIEDRCAVYDVWEGRCHWCRKPIVFADCQIDHVFALNAVKNGAQELRTLYSLPSDFDFDSFENWVPACPSCNGTKGALLLDHSPAMLLHLSMVRGKAIEARQLADKIRSNRRKGQILGRLASHLAAGA